MPEPGSQAEGQPGAVLCAGTDVAARAAHHSPVTDTHTGQVIGTDLQPAAYSWISSTEALKGGLQAEGGMGVRVVCGSEVLRPGETRALGCGDGFQSQSKPN